MGGSGGGTKDKILGDKIFTDIAEAHGVSAGVVSLSWAVQRGICVIPKSASHKRIEDNIKLVTLNDEEMRVMNEAHVTLGRYSMARHIPSANATWTPLDYGWEDEQGNWLC